MYNTKIYLLIFIFLIFIYIFFFNKKNKEFFINKNKKLNKYLKKNKIQEITVELIKLLDKMSNKKKYYLNNKCKKTKYIPGTIDKYVREELNNICNIIIKNLNNNKIFNFTKVNYEDIIEIKDKKGNSNYLFGLFLQENNFLFNIEVKIDVIKFINKKEIIKRNILTCTELTTPEFPNYEIGIPSLDQLIPLPTEVITTSCDVLNKRGISYKKPSKIKYLYINNINIVNSTLVLNPYKKCINNNYNSSKDKVLPFSYINNYNNPIIEESIKRNKWPLLKSQPKNKKAWPCKLFSQDWNDEGIYVPQVKPTKLCPGIRSSTKQQPLTGEYWPTLATIPRNTGSNTWLFDLSRGIPQFNT
jgi:hypothetical protein